MIRELRNDFPIIRKGGSTKLAFPSVLLYEHEAQAKRNHYQTLDELRARGGLSVDEMVAIMEDREWRPMDFLEAYERLCEIAQAEANKR